MKTYNGNINNGSRYLAVVLIDRNEKREELEKQLEFTAGNIIKELEKTKEEIKEIEGEICKTMDIGEKLTVKIHICDYLLEVQKGRTNVSYKGIVEEIITFIQNKYRRLERIVNGLIEKHTSISKKVIIEKISETEKVEQQSLLQ